MNDRYDKLLAAGRRKITRDSGEPVYLVVIDEYAYFSATVGTKAEREKFAALTRDLVARGRAAGVIVILATQRPSHQVIDPSMRDLFGYRWAFRCTTDSSSDTVLGHGWASEGYTAAEIDPLARGVGWLLSETGIPRRIKAAYLTDADIATWPPTPPSCAAPGRGMTPHTPSPPCPAPATGPAGRKNTVNDRLTPKRPRPVVENDAYAAFARRILRAYARRIASGDIEALTLITDLARRHRAPPSAQAVIGLRELRLLLGRHRHPARRHPPGRPATLGSPAIVTAATVPLTPGHPARGGRTADDTGRSPGQIRRRTPLTATGIASTRSGSAAASTPSTWPPANCGPCTTPPASPTACC